MSEEINVPLLDLRAQYDTIRDEIEPILRDVVESQWFVMGPKVADFGQAVAEYCGAEHAVGCASGSDSLLLALMASDIGPGDEVICPSYTFFATAGSIWRLGAKPIFCDIDPTTYNCTVETVTDAIGRCKNLKAIMPVHLLGRLSISMASWHWPAQTKYRSSRMPLRASVAGTPPAPASAQEACSAASASSHPRISVDLAMGA